MNLHWLIRLSADLLEALGVLVLVLSVVVAAIRVVIFGVKHGWHGAYPMFRVVLGRGILLGLEFLVAADIIRTITEELVLANVFSLGLIVLIRTFLSVMLEIELEGRAPWNRHRVPSGQPTQTNDLSPAERVEAETR